METKTNKAAYKRLCVVLYTTTHPQGGRDPIKDAVQVMVAALELRKINLDL